MRISLQCLEGKHFGGNDCHGVKFEVVSIFFFFLPIICVIHQAVGRQAWSKPGIQELSEALPSPGRSALPIKQRMLASKEPTPSARVSRPSSVQWGPLLP